MTDQCFGSAVSVKARRSVAQLLMVCASDSNKRKEYLRLEFKIRRAMSICSMGGEVLPMNQSIVCTEVLCLDQERTKTAEISRSTWTMP